MPLSIPFFFCKNVDVGQHCMCTCVYTPNTIFSFDSNTTYDVLARRFFCFFFLTRKLNLRLHCHLLPSFVIMLLQNDSRIVRKFKKQFNHLIYMCKSFQKLVFIWMMNIWLVWWEVRTVWFMDSVPQNVRNKWLTRYV